MTCFLGIPNYGAIESQTVLTIMNATNKPKVVYMRSSSILIENFNQIWCAMMNTKGMQYFIMLHADVFSAPGWADMLIEQLELNNLDVLSVVIPLKEDTGITSTGVLSPDMQNIHRFTLEELKKYPSVFTEEHTKADHPGTLLVNTGMWIARVGDWMKEFDGFKTFSEVKLNPETEKYEERCSPEDWDFSVFLKEKGIKYGATTLVKVGHVGKKAWLN